MANTIADGTTAQHWMPKVQRELRKRSVALGIADVYSGADRIIHNPYTSSPVGSDGTVSSASYSVTDFTNADDTLTVNRRADVAEHIDQIEMLQQRYDLAMQRAERHSYVVRDKVDQYALNLPVSMSGVADIDDGTFGGTIGNPKVTSNSNIDEVANAIIEAVSLNDGALDRGMFWIISPYEVTDITSFQQNNGFSISDASIRNGFLGNTPFAGLDLYVSNNLTHTVTLTMDTNPTNGDTMTLTVPGNGGGKRSVVVTFVGTLSGGAGEVHIASTVDITRANLERFLDAYGATTEVEATDTGFTALSTADSNALKRAQIATTNDNGANTLAIVVKSTLAVAETFTAGTNVFGTVARHTIAGVKGSLFVALPSNGMTFEKKSVGQKHGKELVTAQIYEATIWNNLKGEIFDVVVA